MLDNKTPAWFPLYLLLLFGATLSPLWIHCAPHSWSFRGFFPIDLIGNILLFVPLGIAFRSRPALAVACLAVFASGGIELLQRWLPRLPSPLDVVTNLIGAMLGRWLPLPRVPTIDHRLLAVGLGLLSLASLAASLASLALRQASDFSNWDAYPLMIGNEFTRDRPWFGMIEEVAIYDRALDRDEIEEPDEGRLARGWREGGPILSLRFRDPAHGHLDGPSGRDPLSPHPPADVPMHLRSDGLSTRGGLWVLPDKAARHVRERLTESGAFSLHARIRADDLSARGPARIVSLSADTSNRNFTLGQDERELVLRIRTPGTGPNGHFEAQTADSPLGQNPIDVWGIFDGQVASIFVDRICRADQHLAMRAAPELIGVSIVTTIIVVTALSGLAAAAMSRSSRRRGRQLWLVCGGASAWLFLFFAGCWEHLPYLDVPAVLVGVASLTAAAPLCTKFPGFQSTGSAPKQ